MYIIFIAVFYIWLMMVITSPNLADGIAITVFGGAALGLLYYLLNTATRRLRKRIKDSSTNEQA